MASRLLGNKVYSESAKCELRQQLYDALEQAKSEGRISEDIYRGLKGEAVGEGQRAFRKGVVRGREEPHIDAIKQKHLLVRTLLSYSCRRSYGYPFGYRHRLVFLKTVYHKMCDGSFA